MKSLAVSGLSLPTQPATPLPGQPVPASPGDEDGTQTTFILRDSSAVASSSSNGGVGSSRVAAGMLQRRRGRHSTVLVDANGETEGDAELVGPLLPTTTSDVQRIHRAEQVYQNDAPLHKLALYFCSWMCSGIFANMYNKKVMAGFPLPVSLTMFQFMATTLGSYILTRRMTGKPIQPMPARYRTQTAMVACGYVFNNTLSHISIWKVPVSFTHTIKAGAPVFAVLLSYLFLGDVYTWQVYASLVPIISGVGLATVSEVNFDMYGFCTAILSTAGMCSQHIMSKKLFRTGQFDNLSLLFWTSLYALPPMAVMMLVMEGPGLIDFFSDPELDFILLLLQCSLSGFALFLQSVFAFKLLSHITPLSYAVASTAKRTLLISFSILYFENEVNASNALGIALAVSGVLMYNLAKYQMNFAAAGRVKPFSV